MSETPKPERPDAPSSAPLLAEATARVAHVMAVQLLDLAAALRKTLPEGARCLAAQPECDGRALWWPVVENGRQSDIMHLGRCPFAAKSPDTPSPGSPESFPTP